MTRDPLDTKVAALQEQAVHLRIQLLRIENARAAIARFGADADQLIANLAAAEAAALTAWVARDRADAAMEFAHRRSVELLEEVETWNRLVRRYLAWVGPSWAVSRVREALPTYTNRFPRQPANVRASVTALTVHAAALGASERLDPLRAQGADLADRLDAHAAHLENCAQRSTDTAAKLRAARATLLAECRAVRAAWSAARIYDPHVPRLDLRIVRAEAAISRRVRVTKPGPSEPPTDGPATAAPPAADPSPTHPSTPPSAPASQLPTTTEAPPLSAHPMPADPDGPTTTVRVMTTVEVVDLDPCEPPDR